MRKFLFVSLILVLVAVFVAPVIAEARCWQCDHVFNSWFCFPGFPGRSECVDTPTDCAMSGAFCDLIVVVG